MNVRSSSSRRGKAEPKSKDSEKEEKKPGPGDPEAWVKIVLQVLTLAGVIYGAYFTYLQSTAPIKMSIAATQTAEAKPSLNGSNTSGEDNVAVSFNNPETNRASVQLIIRDAEHPNDDPIVRIVIEPGGTVPINNLVPGKYQIEARPIYPVLTPQAANCYIQWQPSESHRGDLVITSTNTVFQIKQFDLEPREVCFVETAIATSSTPTP